jgi:putative ABC transport system permease protein
MDAFLRDLRYTLRSFRGTLRLSLAAIGCVALGIGGAMFILTVANAVLVAPPPFPDADRLVRVWTVRDATGQTADVSYPDIRDVQARARSFEAVELAARTRTAFTTATGTERVRGESVTPGYFGMIAVRPSLGRAFSPDEYRPDAPRVMIIGHALWMRTFGGRPDIVGQTVTARGNAGMAGEGDRSYTIVGVMPPGFAGTVDPDISEFWLPIEQYTPRMLLDARRTRSTWVLARLRPNVSVTAAHAEVAAIGRQLAAEHPDDYRDLSLAVEPVGESWRERFRDGLTMVTVAAGLLLLIACVNIAYLLLTRLAHREHELRIRVALGAQRSSIVRQLLLESVTLTVVGGAIGTVLAVWGVKTFAAAEVFRLPSYVPLSVDASVVAVASGLMLVTAILSGALPAAFVSRVGSSQQLREIGRGTTPGRKQRLAIDGLVAAEIAFSFLLLTASMLMVRTYANLVRSDLGFRTENLQRLAVSLDPREFARAEQQLGFVREAKAELAAQPGVTGVSFIAGVLPPWFDPEVQLSVGGALRPELAAVARHAVDEDFFRVMDIAVRDGRAIAASDRADTRRVAVVSASVARALAGGDGRGALGTELQIAADPRRPSTGGPLLVVGIAEDVRYNGPRADRKADHDIYVPMTQAPSSILSIAVTTARDPGPLLPSLQRTLGRLAPTSPLHWVSTMEEELALQFGDARLYAWLTGVFGASALLLVTIGIYGVISNAVTRRWSELGVRMAIGARPADIVALVLGQASRPMLLGIVVGALASLAAATLATSLVYGIASTDPLTYVGVGVILLGTGLVACLLPARRATRLDPKDVLQVR